MKSVLKIIAGIMMLVMMSGCGSSSTVMTIGDTKVPLGEAVYLLREMESMFENQYGSSIWEVGQGGKTFNEIAKESALESLSRLYVTKLEAEKRGVTLTQEEMDVVDNHLEETLNAMSEATLKEDGISNEDIRNIYMYDALGIKLMDDQLVNFEVDEAALNESLEKDPTYAQIQKYGYEGFLEQVTAQHILIATINPDETPKTDAEKEKALETAELVLQKINEGEDFTELVKLYSEDPQKDENNGIYTFVKGEMQIEFEEAAFNMQNDEISDLVETRFGYHIIKKIDHIYPGEDEIQNVQEYEKYIVEQYKIMQKQSAFEVLYQEWKNNYDTTINENVWNKVQTSYEKYLDANAQ